MAQVRWTHQALNDLEAICLFIARDAPQVATVFADRAFRATDHLADHPRLGRIVPELAIETIREVILGNYRIIYRIRQDEVQVVTIHHVGLGCSMLARSRAAHSVALNTDAPRARAG